MIKTYEFLLRTFLICSFFILKIRTENDVTSNDITMTNRALIDVTVEEDAHELKLNISWSVLNIDLNRLKRHYVKYSLNGTNFNYYLISNQLNAYDTSNDKLNVCFMSCFNNSKCTKFTFDKLNDTCLSNSQCTISDEFNICGEIKNYKTQEIIAPFFVNTNVCFIIGIMDDSHDIHESNETCFKNLLNLKVIIEASAIFLAGSQGNLECLTEPLIASNLIVQYEWLKNGNSLKNNSNLYFNSIGSSNQGSYNCRLLLINGLSLTSQTYGLNVVRLVARLTSGKYTTFSTDSYSFKGLSFTAQYSDTYHMSALLSKYVDRVRLLISSSFHVGDWPVLVKQTRGTLSKLSLIATETISYSSWCIQNCAINSNCKSVSYESNTGLCMLYNSTYVSNLVNDNQEVHIFESFKPYIYNNIYYLPCYGKISLTVKFHNNFTNTWSDESNELSIFFDVQFNITYKRIGSKRILINPSLKLPCLPTISRFNIIYNRNTIKKPSNYDLIFKSSDTLEPNYVELPFENEIKNTSLEDCLTKCIEKTNCIQYVWINSTRFHPSASLYSCYLQTRLNVNFAISYNNKHGVVGYIKYFIDNHQLNDYSSTKNKIEYESEDLVYSISLQLIDSFGFQQESNTLDISLDPFTTQTTKFDTNDDKKSTILISSIIGSIFGILIVSSIIGFIIYKFKIIKSNKQRVYFQ